MVLSLRLFLHVVVLLCIPESSRRVLASGTQQAQQSFLSSGHADDGPPSACPDDKNDCCASLCACVESFLQFWSRIKTDAEGTLWTTLLQCCSGRRRAGTDHIDEKAEFDLSHPCVKPNLLPFLSARATCGFALTSRRNMWQDHDFDFLPERIPPPWMAGMSLPRRLAVQRAQRQMVALLGWESLLPYMRYCAIFERPGAAERRSPEPRGTFFGALLGNSFGRDEACFGGIVSEAAHRLVDDKFRSAARASAGRPAEGPRWEESCNHVGLGSSDPSPCEEDPAGPKEPTWLAQAHHGRSFAHHLPLSHPDWVFSPGFPLCRHEDLLGNISDDDWRTAVEALSSLRTARWVRMTDTDDEEDVLGGGVVREESPAGGVLAEDDDCHFCRAALRRVAGALHWGLTGELPPVLTAAEGNVVRTTTLRGEEDPHF